MYDKYVFNINYFYSNFYRQSNKDKSSPEKQELCSLRRPEKPEKPERKFNSRELIEKQRNWTSHFSKARVSKSPTGENKRTSLNLQVHKLYFIINVFIIINIIIYYF